MEISSQERIKLTIPGSPPLYFIPVEGGPYRIGELDSSDRGKYAEGTLQSFQMGQYPITNAQYLAFVKATDSNHLEWLKPGSQYHFEKGSDDHYRKLGAALYADNHPVMGVSWGNAIGYCKWLSQQGKGNFRLPSEAEWEYAARGGKYSQGFPYAGSHRFREVGWNAKNSHGGTMPVGLKLPNELGLYDMSGNVWEWCQDVWHDDYKGAPKDGSAWIKGGEQDRRVVRGGSWDFSDDGGRVSYRGWSYRIDSRDLLNGFRVVRY